MSDIRDTYRAISDAELNHLEYIARAESTSSFELLRIAAKEALALIRAEKHSRANRAHEAAPHYNKHGTAMWLIDYISSHPDVKYISFQDGIMYITLTDGSKVIMTEPKRIV